MNRHVFARFLTDAHEYAKAEAYWDKLWRKALEKTGKAKAWRAPWLSTRFQNGKPLLDGNPIFSAINETERLGVRIIQHPPSSKAVELESWLDEFGASAQGDGVRVLVISCVLSEETAARCVDLIRGWVIQEASAA